MIAITDNLIELIKEWGQGIYERMAGIKKGFDESQESMDGKFRRFSRNYVGALAATAAIMIGSGYLLIKSHDDLQEALARQKPAAAQPSLESKLESPISVMQQATQFVSDHLKAWEDGNWQQYFGNYADNCEVQTNKGTMDKPQLIEYKRGINQNNNFRRIEVENGFNVKQVGEEILVNFRQRYSSQNYTDLSDKTMVLAKSGNSMKILKETYELVR